MAKLQLFVAIAGFTLCMSCGLTKAARSSSSNPAQTTTNLTQSLKIVKLSYNEYEHRINTTPNSDAPTKVRKFRDYVVTLRNDSDREVLAYRFALKGQNGKTTNARLFYPIYDKESFPPGAEITAHAYRLPAEDSFELNSAIFKGGRWEGEENAATELLTRLRASNAKLAAINQRIGAISRLSSGQAQGAARLLLEEIERERQLLATSKKEHTHSPDEMYRAMGEHAALNIAFGHVRPIALAKDSASVKRLAIRAEQRLNNSLTKLQ